MCLNVFAEQRPTAEYLERSFKDFIAAKSIDESCMRELVRAPEDFVPDTKNRNNNNTASIFRFFTFIT